MRVGSQSHTDAASGLHGFDAERQAQVTFAASRRPDQMQGLGAVDELRYFRADAGFANLDVLRVLRRKDRR